MSKSTETKGINDMSLGHSDDKYNRLIEQMNQGYALKEMIYDEQGKPIDYRFLKVNPAFVNMTCFKVEDLEGFTALEILPDIDKSLIEKYAQVVLDGKTINFVYSIAPIGRVYEITAFYTEKKQFVCIYTDITERQIAEENLRASETRFKALHNASFGGIGIHDKGLIIDCNQGLSDMTGYSRDELVGMNGLLLIAEQSRNYVMDKIISGNEKPYEALGVRKNGEIFPLRLEARNILYKGKNIRSTELRDITARKKAEKELKESETRFSLFLEKSPIYVFFKDENARVLKLSKNYEKLLGLPLESIIGKTMDELFPSEMAKKMVQDDLEVLRSGNVVEIIEELNGRMFSTTKFPVTRDGEPSFLAGFTIDITERKKMEDAVRESENKFRSFFENSIDALAISNKGITVFANDALVKMFGYSSSDEVNGKTVLNLIAPNQREFVNKNIQDRVGQLYAPAVYETRGLRKNGNEFDLDVSISSFESNGEILSLVKLSDITESKLTDRKLRISESRTRAYLKSSPTCTRILDLDLKLIYMNNQGLKAFNLGNVENYYGEPYPFNFYPKSFKDIMTKDLHIALETGQNVEQEAAVVDVDGNELWFHSIISPVKDDDGKMDYIMVISIDITDRKKAELALFAEKERLSVTLRSIGDGVITTDINGNITMLNKVAENLTGWTSDEAIGKPLPNVFNIINEITRVKCANPVDQVMLTGKNVELANHTCLIAKDGREIVIADSGSPIHDNDNHIVGVVLVFRDMTEKQKLDTSMRRAQKLESIGLLAGGIAHDFNNILSGIYSNIEMALNKSADDSLTKYLSNSLSSIHRVRALTQQLLTFAKGGAPVKDVANLFPFVQETVEFALSGSSISSSFTIQEDLYTCDFDKNQIGQVIDNLVINAQQAMPTGGKIEVSAQNIHFGINEHVSLSDGNYIKLSIKDFGKGIPKEQLSQIFDPYYTTKSKGQGLGLSTCYSIINRHGGCIDIDTELGVGSTFNVYLPASDKVVLDKKEEIAISHIGSGVFLVMDDEEIIREILKLTLESFGYTVVLTDNGKDAIDYFMAETNANRKIAGMIFDLTIPGGIGGKDAIMEIRKICSDTPAFVSSGYSHDPIMAHPQKYGFNASLLKPFLISDLSEILQKYVKN